MRISTDAPRIGTRRATSGVGMCFVLAAIVLGGCSSTPSASPTTTTTVGATPSSTASTTSAVSPTSSSTTEGADAPCTQGAISAAAKATSIGPVLGVSGFACSGSWAYANVTVGTSISNSYDAVIVLQVSGGNWVVADRATTCSNHLVPTAIYTPACTTS